MRHLNKGRKFGRKKGQRKAFIRTLANNLIQHGKITTTEARAKELRGVVERYVTYGKRQTVSALRTLIRHLPKSAAYKMYHEIAPKYVTRKGGYTRVLKMTKGRRHDASKMAVIEFI